MSATLPLFPALASGSASPALRVGERALSYEQLARACRSFAATLDRLGVSAGARIAVWTHPALETLVGLLSCVEAGVTLVPLNPQLGDKELTHILGSARPEAVFSTQPATDAPRTPLHAVHALSFTDDAATGTSQRGLRSADQPLLLVYTSGTTGLPKGALLSARNLTTSLDGLAQAFALSPRDTIVHALPLFHVHGLVVGWFGALRAGACLRFVPKFQPEALGAALATASSVLYAVPTMYHRLADAAERSAELRDQLAGARLLVSGSAALSAREHARLNTLTGQTVRERYGLTETLINTAVACHDLPMPGAVGRALTGIEVRLVDDQRQPQVAGTDAIGEVAVRGANVFLGYLDNPEATAQVKDAAGWFYTGDLGTLSASGELRIVGRRATDLIKTGGFKVGAGEIEGALLEHPAVAECAVVGKPDPDLGERIVAFVVLREGTAAPGADELIEHVSQALSKHKRPREVRFMAELPRNAMGKVQKPRLLPLLE